MERKARVVLDTNILISALGFGGKPREILNLAIDKKLKAISSPILLAEFEDVVSKKFPVLANDLNLSRILRQLKKNLKIVKPQISIHVLDDESDNRVLEAAVQGECWYIITGDKDLLNLKMFKNISILKPDKFLSQIQV